MYYKTLFFEMKWHVKRVIRACFKKGTLLWTCYEKKRSTKSWWITTMAIRQAI